MGIVVRTSPVDVPKVPVTSMAASLMMLSAAVSAMLNVRITAIAAMIFLIDVQELFERAMLQVSNTIRRLALVLNMVVSRPVKDAYADVILAAQNTIIAALTLWRRA